jgi:hypothetical protein
MIEYFLWGIVGLVGLFHAVCYYAFYHLMVRSPRAPFDDTNRFNRLRVFFWSCKRPYLFDSMGYGRFKLVLTALHREDKLAHLFDWTRNDEWENISR